MSITQARWDERIYLAFLALNRRRSALQLIGLCTALGAPFFQARGVNPGSSAPKRPNNPATS